MPISWIWRGFSRRWVWSTEAFDMEPVSKDWDLEEASGVPFSLSSGKPPGVDMFETTVGTSRPAGEVDNVILGIWWKIQIH